MSGIEIAGLLLGAFPLLISALEHYRQSAEVLDDWWQIKQEYKKCKNEIKLQELAFEGSLERFLLPLVVDDNQIAALIAEPGGTKWKDPALEDKVKSRLPKSYDLFIDTIYDIKTTVDDLKEELGVNREAFQKGLDPKVDQERTGKSRNPLRRLLNRPKQEASTGGAENNWKKWLSRPNIEYQTHRVKFGFGRANRAKLFEDFARYNARLRELLDTNDRSAALRQSRQHIKNTAAKKTLWKYWRHAASLHDLLCQAWRCQCKNLHRACLLLHHETNIERIEFSICFLYAPTLVDSNWPWNWKEVNIQHISHEIPEANISLVLPQDYMPQFSVPTPSFNPATRTVDRDPISGRRVRWINPPNPAANSKRRNFGPQRIFNLCNFVTACDPAKNILGVLEGEEGSYVLRQGTKTKPPKEANQTVSLESLLNRSSAFRLDRRQRYRIAYTLASSHLQLYPSPWLHSHWSKKDIIFALDPQDPRSIQVDQPYILHALSTQPPPLDPPPVPRDRSLPTLGILLIELCFGTALEDQELRRQFRSAGEQQAATPDSTAILDLAVAMEWSQSVGGEAGETYAEAVNWCLMGQVAGARGDRWREELFANVVRPLQSCHEQLNPVSREEWLDPAPAG